MLVRYIFFVLEIISICSHIFFSLCAKFLIVKLSAFYFLSESFLSRNQEIVIFTFAGLVQHSELEEIHNRYMNCLKIYTEWNFPTQPNRVQELLVKLPEV